MTIIGLQVCECDTVDEIFDGIVDQAEETETEDVSESCDKADLDVKAQDTNKPKDNVKDNFGVDNSEEANIVRHKMGMIQPQDAEKDGNTTFDFHNDDIEENTEHTAKSDLAMMSQGDDTVAIDYNAKMAVCPDKSEVADTIGQINEKRDVSCFIIICLQSQYL